MIDIGADTYMTFEDFCALNNIIVVYHNFTTKIRGLCVKQDDYYIVAINPKFSTSSQKKTLQHESRKKKKRDKPYYKRLHTIF